MKHTVQESSSNLREKSADELEDLVVVIWQLIVQESLHFANALVSLQSCNDSKTSQNLEYSEAFKLYTYE